MKKLIRFIKNNPLVKGKYTFLSLIFFFFHHESLHLTLLPRTMQLLMRSFCEKKLSNRLRHMKNKGVRQSRALSRNSEVIDV